MSSRKLGPGFPNAYSGGYSESIKRQIDRVILPDKIKCGTCKKFRFINAYSNRQLEALRHAVVVKGARASTSGYARCLTCTGGSLAELKCSACDRVKPVDDFAKNQRQARDSARCLNCVQKHSETEPLVDEHKMITDGDSTTASAATSQIGGSSVVGSTRRIQGSESHYDGSIYGNDDDDDDQSIAGGVFLEKENTDENSSRHGKEREFIGYDPQGNPHRMSIRIEAPDPADLAEDAASIHSGWTAWGVKKTDPSDVARAIRKKEPKFAKIRGYRFEKGEGPSMSVPEPTGQTIPSDDEDEDNDLDSFL
ncbi:hypothetical protein BO94DRAFT_40471 [Aspergillus sclerotioniger CBS 115572]|uniref:Stc1 domain-containing protein n=1 Tax=Aspergillus sclerotioniger CBS 115572 TaxID=1450535 RepID=A0A317WZ94_9EURO|nr:hypothetical protein BO94DRAFT_40471 [Aspergillus sclerotioniger CBS 115572]PWY89550.1 hypothetical protein BO94DRAFT_40471 [Aspergillus sclerotioniger CBS 115572]